MMLRTDAPLILLTVISLRYCSQLSMTCEKTGRDRNIIGMKGALSPTLGENMYGFAEISQYYFRTLVVLGVEKVPFIVKIY